MATDDNSAPGDPVAQDLQHTGQRESVTARGAARKPSRTVASRALPETGGAAASDTLVPPSSHVRPAPSNEPPPAPAPHEVGRSKPAERSAPDREQAQSTAPQSTAPQGSPRAKPSELWTLLRGNPEDVRRIRFGDHDEPHQVLGPHPASFGTHRGWVVRAYHPEAQRVTLRLASDDPLPMHRVDQGVFAAFVPDATEPTDQTSPRKPPSYELLFRRNDGRIEQIVDPYRFAPIVQARDLESFDAGEHARLWEVLGAHPRVIDGTAGTAFAAWAPRARRVSVVGAFCDWDGRRLSMRSLGNSGVWELFVPGMQVGTEYEYEIRTEELGVLRKTDPFAFESGAVGAASRIARSEHIWHDADWIRERPTRRPEREPMAVYEVHAGSWARAETPEDRPLTYRELAPRLVEHAKRFGFTHIELLPVSEHAFYGSWGYEVTGLFAPTSRYGSPDDLRHFVDYCHQHGVGVILDWVPAHFPRDATGLARFDGTALFEVGGSGSASLTSWGTHRFDLSRPQVRNYLLANALYWVSEFHVDGLRVDAIACMLGRSYAEGSVLPAADERSAAAFLRQLNRALGTAVPGVITIAEDSSTTTGMTRPASEGGFGFTFKWNLGWMHDTLNHFSRPPVDRASHRRELTFSMLYEHEERFINAVSHDEVVHGKRSLLAKMPGTLEERLDNLRLLLAYQYTRPGKKLLFMGTELATSGEWDHDRGLDWGLEDDARRRQLQAYLAELGGVYRGRRALWRSDPDPNGFCWLDSGEPEGALFAYLRSDETDQVVVVLNLGDQPVENGWVAVPSARTYRVLLSTADPLFGGSGGTPGPELAVQPPPGPDQPGRLRLPLPPLTGLLLVPD